MPNNFYESFHLATVIYIYADALESTWICRMNTDDPNPFAISLLAQLFTHGRTGILPGLGAEKSMKIPGEKVTVNMKTNQQNCFLLIFLLSELDPKISKVSLESWLLERWLRCDQLSDSSRQKLHCHAPEKGQTVRTTHLRKTMRNSLSSLPKTFSFKQRCPSLGNKMH